MKPKHIASTLSAVASVDYCFFKACSTNLVLKLSELSPPKKGSFCSRSTPTSRCRSCLQIQP
eukprot:Skav213566  [mRNA]  locus=scaffold3630:166593:173290:+ [translate_table: standard]